MKHINIKQIGIIMFGIVSVFIINLGYCLRIGPITEGFKGEASPQIEGEEIEKIDEGGKTFSDKLGGILHIPQRENYTTSLGYVTTLIQVLINWLLGILSFVALVYMLYNGFLVFSSGSDDKNASKGKKGISTAAIALAGIGLSWLIISAMIRFINNIAS